MRVHREDVSRFVAKCVACRYGMSVRDVCRLPVCPQPECRNVECPRASCLPGQRLIKATGRRGGCCDRCQGPPVPPPPPPPMCARRKCPAITSCPSGYKLKRGTCCNRCVPLQDRCRGQSCPPRPRSRRDCRRGQQFVRRVPVLGLCCNRCIGNPTDPGKINV